MTEHSPSLEVLRARIDATDRELLDVIARRMALVRDIGALKREQGLRIRDAAREAAILENRVATATALGLPAGDMESLFRVLLRSSRDAQSRLRVAPTPDETSKTVAIIGGLGGMGQLFSRVFSELGHTVLICDIDTALTARQAAAAADVVVVSVPIHATEMVIRDIGPFVRDDALLMDLTSIKQEPVRAMLSSTPASVVGTHPMFGPSIHTLQGQRMVVCRARGDQWTEWLIEALSAHGLIVTEVSAEHHDRVMSVVQVLTHFQTQVMGLTLARLGVPLSETLKFTSPIYLLELYTTARHFAQSSELYGQIEMQNPRTGEVTSTLRNAAAELAQIIAEGDQSAFDALFEEVRGFFGTFTTEALEQSSYLIDRIVERT